jgi:DNA repair protein RecO (recombination protein O)
MEWTDEGIVLGMRRHGEASAILEVMTREHGRHLGLVRGGAGPRLAPVLQPGNTISAVWRARLDEHLGHYAVEGVRLRAAGFLARPHAVFGVTHLCTLARLLPERDPHPGLHAEMEAILDRFDFPQSAATRVARFELQLLAELGFGLDLSECAATGTQADLIYVSPKSGRAVSREAGLPWDDKLLRLPEFLHRTSEESAASLDELNHGFLLTAYFLNRHVLEPRGLQLSDARSSFVAAVSRSLADAPS